MLLTINIFLGYAQEFIIIKPFTHIVKKLIGDLFSTENGAGAFADSDGIAGSVNIAAKDFFSFDK